jgi:Domain of unknown function (DUF4760)
MQDLRIAEYIRPTDERHILRAALIAAIIFGSLFFLSYRYPDYEIVKAGFPALISATAIVFSAIWASWFAHHAILNQRATAAQNAISQRETAKLNATLNFIHTTELDNDYIKAKIRWAELSRDEPKKIPALFARSHYGATMPQDVSDSASIRTFFNNFELVALAIASDIIDGPFYRKWHGSSFVTSWNTAAPTIGVLRALTANQKLYEEWERTARQWGTDANRQVTHPPEFSTADLVKFAGLTPKQDLGETGRIATAAGLANEPTQVSAPKSNDGK